MSESEEGKSGSASSEAEDSDAEEEIPELLVTSREKRWNAGRKMAQLLDGEESIDEFYQSAYGGFNEVGLYQEVSYLVKNRYRPNELPPASA